MENKFKLWEAEINKDWIGGYKAISMKGALVITLEGKEVAKINSHFDVTGTDADAVDQLTYMTNR